MSNVQTERNGSVWRRDNVFGCTVAEVLYYVENCGRFSYALFYQWWAICSVAYCHNNIIRFAYNPVVLVQMSYHAITPHAGILF